MILVDSSVWIDYFRGRPTAQTDLLDGLLDSQELAIGDLVFTSDEPKFSSEKLVDLHTTSRTFSMYYPDTRPGADRYTVVVSINARYEDWKALSEE